MVTIIIFGRVSWAYKHQYATILIYTTRIMTIQGLHMTAHICMFLTQQAHMQILSTHMSNDIDTQ